MGDALDIIVKKMNIFGKKLSERSNIYFKKAINKSEEYADRGMQQIEHEKLKWELKKTYTELGTHVYNSNNSQGTMDYSEDEKFILLLDKINRIKNYINQNNKDDKR